MAKEPKQLNLQKQRIFLSYAKEDRGKVRAIYRKLLNEQLNPWLDLHDLLPGQDWDQSILFAIRSARFVIVFLSKHSVTKHGYVQKEIREALDMADRRPEKEIFIIPVRLEDCDIPTRLSKWQCINVHRQGGFQKIVRAIKENLGADIATESKPKEKAPSSSEIADTILLTNLSFGKVFMSAKLPTGRIAFSNGHFLSLREKLPRMFRDAARDFPSKRRLTTEMISAMLPPKTLYRRSGNLMKEIRPIENEASAYILVSKGNKRLAIYKPYMHYIQLKYPTGKVYLVDGKTPIIVEDHDEISFIVMPMRVSDKTLDAE